QLALVQIKGATVQEGNEVTLKCNMERGDMSRYYMYWYRQGPRGKEWISTDGSTYEGFKDRFKRGCSTQEPQARASDWRHCCPVLFACVSFFLFLWHCE
uniref:Ig-like domain-containing protein n=1 Tax=Serinus canaria TaxID=9135 RepID=A0A8C9NFW5_SERCA